ncbi:MAG: RsmB/NOP family class I SAM-dependent RNA methyltransferase [Thiohalocapsa sp.]
MIRDRHRNRDEPTRSGLETALGRYRPLFGEIVDDWDGFIDALLRPLPPCVWSHPARIGASSFRALIADEGVCAEPVRWLEHAGTGRALRLPPGFRAGQRWWYCAGLAHAQEEVSQLPVLAMDLHPGNRVLDLCAAPGGKTAQIALAIGNRGTLLANDFAPERIAALQGNLDRLGIVNCSTTWCDGANYPVGAGSFDRVLVDAPCSSEGTLRRNRSLAARLGPGRSERMAGRQRALLRKAAQLCRPGGRIVYSTCTFAPEENEIIVAEALDEAQGRLRLLPFPVEGLATSPGVTRWQGRVLDPLLALCTRVWPHLNDTGGFFVAVLQKAADAPEVSPATPARLHLEEEDRCWVDRITGHYGLGPWAESRYRLHRQTRRGLHVIAADHAPPNAPAAQGSGLFVHRTNVRPPKLTTGGALLLGPLATRQGLDLTAVQRDAYLRRRSFTPSAEQIRECRAGQVLVRYLGFTLGVAVLHRSGTLESLFPRRWSGCTAGA